MKSPAAVAGGNGRRNRGNVERLPRVSERRELSYSKRSGSEVGGDSKSVDVVSQDSGTQAFSGSRRKAYRTERKTAHLMKSQRILHDEEEGDEKRFGSSRLDDDRWLFENWRSLILDNKSHTDPIHTCLPCRVVLRQIKKAARNRLPPKPGQDSLVNDNQRERAQARSGLKRAPARAAVWRQPTVAEGRVDYADAPASLPPQGVLQLSSMPPAKEGDSTDVAVHVENEATLRPFAKLPNAILCKILTYLNAEDLTRIERVCRVWQGVAKHAWTSSTVSNLDLAKYYMRNCADEVLRKCGPYIKKFVFTPKLEHRWNLLRVTFTEELLALKSLFGLANVDTVCIRSVKIRRRSRIPGDLADAFLGNNFANATELILADDFAQYCDGLNFALTMKCLTRLSISDGNFAPRYIDIAPSFSSLSSTLECAHFGYSVSAGSVDDFAKHVALLVNLKELSLEFREALYGGCESCGYGADEPSDTFGLSDATMLALASSCKKLKAMLIYHPARVSETVVPKVIGRLKDIQVFWRGGKFLFPPIHNRGDFDSAAALLNGTWVRRALERRGYDVENECDFEEYCQPANPLPQAASET